VFYCAVNSVIEAPLIPRQFYFNGSISMIVRLTLDDLLLPIMLDLNTSNVTVKLNSMETRCFKCAVNSTFIVQCGAIDQAVEFDEPAIGKDVTTCKGSVICVYIYTIVLLFC